MLAFKAVGWEQVGDWGVGGDRWDGRERKWNGEDTDRRDPQPLLNFKQFLVPKLQILK
jgi:hypothetical protein